MPTVSVIMPAYQVTPYIADALDSVLAQTRKDYEVIVVNDACPDTVNLERVLAPYLSRIRYVKLERNSGVAAARNAGIEAAQATYVAFLDADDTWTPDYLDTNLGMLLADPALDVAYGNARVFGQTADAGVLLMDTLPSVGEVDFSSLVSLRCNVIVSCTARRETLQRAGLFDVRQRRCEDFDLWLRVAKAGGRFAYHRKVVLNYRRRDQSQSSDGRVSLRAMIDYCEKVKREFDLTPAEFELTEKQRQTFAAQLDLVEGKQAFEAGRTREALDHFARAQAFYHSPKLWWVMLSMRIAPGPLRWLDRVRRQRALARAAPLSEASGRQPAPTPR